MGFRLIRELADDGIDVAVACRVLGVSRSGYYEWRGRTLSARGLEDAYLANQIVDIHTMSRGSCGALRTHAELRLGLGVRVGRKRVARLLRLTSRAENLADVPVAPKDARSGSRTSSRSPSTAAPATAPDSSTTSPRGPDRSTRTASTSARLPRASGST